MSAFGNKIRRVTRSLVKTLREATGDNAERSQGSQGIEDTSRDSVAEGQADITSASTSETSQQASVLQGSDIDNRGDAWGAAKQPEHFHRDNLKQVVSTHYLIYRLISIVYM